MKCSKYSQVSISNSLYCASCRTRKHRQEFRVIGEKKAAYGALCKECRRKAEASCTNRALLTRVNRGVLSLEKYEQLKEKRKLMHAQKREEKKQEKIKQDIQQSWVPVLRAINIARSVINNRSFNTIEKKQWKHAVNTLVNEAKREYNRRKHIEICPFGQRPPWYAPLPNGVARFREVVDNYPEGADKAPLKVF